MTKFPYRPQAGDFFPIIEFVARAKKRPAKIIALVDSGATVSIWKPEVAIFLDIKIESGQPIFLGGVGGRIKGYIHHLNIQLANKTLKVPVVFSYEYTVRRPS